MSRRHPRPGLAPFPRHGVLRVNDLAPPGVALDDVRAALAARGIEEGHRDAPVCNRVRALLASTAAGTVITLERRGDFRHPRFLVLRHLSIVLESLLKTLENEARGSRKPGDNRTERRPGVS